MKLTTIILAMATMTGAAVAQSAAANNNQSSVPVATPMQKAPQAKPIPGAPAPAVKPAVIPGAKPVAPAKPASSAAPKAAAAPVKPAAKPSSASASQNNRLEGVHVVRNAEDVEIEISSREAVTPKVDKLSSPARIVVELPATIMATSQSKIPVGDAGIKGVRIGMDGKTPPTTSVVVDLERAMSYELLPGPGNKFVLKVDTVNAVAKTAPTKSGAPQIAAKPVIAVTATPKVAAAPATKTPFTSPKVAIAAAPASSPKVAAVAAPAANAKAPANAKAAPVVVAPVKVEAKAVPANGKPAAPANSKIAAANTKIAPPVATPIGTQPAAGVAKAEAAKPAKEEKKWAMTGKRDPFFSPVVQQNAGSGCSTGKKCLDIGQINVRGVVKSDSGFIAVVTNSLNKAYFLHENDPVFNGYVVRITGDSVVFQETMQDKLGKPFTREVTKKIMTPAV